MGGVRLSALVLLRSCSPPFTNTDLTDTGSVQVFRACTGDTPGLATQITNFSDGRIVNEDIANPVLSPDGRKILFEILSNSNDWEVWVVNATPGSTPVQLVAVLDEHYYHPSWGVDSDTFLYVKGSENRFSEAMTIFKDTVSSPGSPVTVKTQATGFGRYLARPRFNFDGTRIAYMQFNGTSSTFRCMNADGTSDGSIATITDYDFNDPPCFSWANTQNLLAWQDGSTGVWLANDTGGGLVDLNSNGVAAGLPGSISHLAWPADDSFVVWGAALAVEPGLVSIIRSELDGSNTTELNALHGPSTGTWMRTPVVYQNRIWFIEFEGGDNYVVGSVAMDGTDYQVALDITLGTPDMEPFASTWGIYWN